MTSAGHRLRALAHKHLQEGECAALKQAVQSFRQTRSVLSLSGSLRNLLDTRAKLALLPAIFPMVPPDLRADFDRLCCLHFEGYASEVRPQILEAHGLALECPGASAGPSSSQGGGGRRPKRKSSARVLLPVEQLRSAISIDARNKAVALSHQKQQQQQRAAAALGPSGRADVIRVRRDSSRSSEGRKEHKRSRTMDADVRRLPQVPSLALNSSDEQQRAGGKEKAGTPRRESGQAGSAAIQIRKIKLTHRENESLGFSIRGGKDLNAGIYVSEVDPGGQAERHGLKVGERVLKVNDTAFKSITHAQAVVALKSAQRLTLYVAPVGTMPGSTPNGTPRSEINSARSANSQQSAKSTASSSRHGKADEGDGSKVRQVTIIAEEDGFLGCSIRGGVDYAMEVTVANVDPMSPAYRAGLKRGLLITKVNGVSVESLTHVEIVSLVTASNVVVLDVTAAPKKPSQSKERKARHVRSQTAESVIARPRTEERFQPPPPESPKQTGRLAPNYAAFELELQATPPISTSTPLPPEDHPALIANRRHNPAARGDEVPRALSPDSEEDPRFITILHDSHELDNSGDSVTANTPRDGAKFDMGTIRLNLANQGLTMTDPGQAKILNCGAEEQGGQRHHRAPAKKEHVKDIFHLNANVEEYRTPVGSPKVDRNTASGGLNTPEKNRYIKDNLNMLSSPYNNVEQELRLAGYRPATPSKQLATMRPLVSCQVQQELTGRRAKPPICPNIPVAQTSPVSKFFKRILRRNSESGSRSGSIGGGGSLRSSSLESLNEDRLSLNSLGSPTADKSPIHRSAYDLMTENRADVTLL